MTKKEAQELARRIPKESATQTRTKIGQTNGAYLVHVVDTEARDKRTAAYNVASAAEWAGSEHHKRNRRREAPAPEPVEPELKVTHLEPSDVSDA